MGVYIKGMEMPIDGFITVTITSDSRVVGNSKRERDKFEYLDNEDIAKAVPVPAHGRLGDLDELEAKMRRKTNEQFCVNMICEAPTIIPAEEGET